MKNAPKQEEAFSLKRELYDWVESVVISIAVVAVIITFVARPIMVDGPSMENTLFDRERLIITSLVPKYQKGDIVIVRRRSDTAIVKRIIATEGQIVRFDYDHHALYVDDVLQDEAYIKEVMNTPIYHTISFPAVVPEGCVFVLGDNRNHSSDSRDPDIGMIDTRNILGKAILRVWPFDRFGGLK